jgi:hypothetical protein
MQLWKIGAAYINSAKSQKLINATQYNPDLLSESASATLSTSDE